MKLWLLSQNINRGYDTFDSAVVAAETADEARCIHPRENLVWHNNSWGSWLDGQFYPEVFEDAWVLPDEVKVRELGDAKPGTKRGVICASFNAG